MTDQPDDDTPDMALAREAARLFRRLEESPDDPEAQDAVKAFLDRGEPERETYAAMSRALAAARTGIKEARRKTKRNGVVAAAAMLLAGSLAYQPAKVSVLADHRSQRTVEEFQLASGDRLHLDAASAVRDDTEGLERRVTLLRGAAYLDVEQGGRRFVVDMGGVTAEALGTSFEVSRSGRHGSVTVFEGLVEVRKGDRSWDLTAGDRINWSAGVDPVKTSVDTETVASWRGSQFIADGHTVGEVAEILDRRLPGDVVVLGRTLAQTPMTGGLNLKSPETALDLLALSTDARVIHLPFLTILRPSEKN
ncbi:MAG: FecR domain-containing protein [Pseudomonadota bacterium]